MISSLHAYKVIELLGPSQTLSFEVPKYQREYTWKRDLWEALFEDLLENEPGYFLGSIICINASGDTLKPRLEIIDGQQRLITLSLLSAALYTWLSTVKANLDEDQLADLVNLKRTLVYEERARVEPQLQGKNSDDYRYVLGVSRVTEEPNKPPSVTARRIYKAYDYFLGRIRKISAAPDSIRTVMNFRKKMLDATLVKIEVNSASDAYVLFESLNNRGTPLTAVDLIKNKMLAELGKSPHARVDHHYQKWTTLIDRISGEFTVRERFLRHFYNASRSRFALKGMPVAKRANLIVIYEDLVKQEGAKLLDSLDDASKLYANFAVPMDIGQKDELTSEYRNLALVQGAPAYTLMLYVTSRRAELKLSDPHITTICRDLVAFFVRRNLTSLPPTNQLDAFFISVIDSIENSTGANAVSTIRGRLLEFSQSDEVFREALSGPIYDENELVARFILCNLEQRHNRKEIKDLWSSEQNNYVFTIEHILPQGENLRQEWIDMIAGGNRRFAREIQQEYVHKIGNLTLSGYNSELGNKSFIDKRDRVNKSNVPIGYRNGLWLNQDLASAEKWTVEQIESRSEKLTQAAMEMYRLAA